MSKILVVDDVPSVCELVAVALEEAGYEVVTATSGREAIQHCKKSEFDLLITDLLMPEMDGFELMNSIHRISPNIQMIVMTAGGAISSETYLDLASHRLKACAALEKPLQLPVLLDETRKALGEK